MKYLNDSSNRLRHYLVSADHFMLDYTSYECDGNTGRHYFLEPSCSTTSRAGREGALVRRRISKADYQAAYEKCCALLCTASDTQETQETEDVYINASNVATNQLRYQAELIESGEGAALPHISTDDMIADYEAVLRAQIKSAQYDGVTPHTAAAALSGFAEALCVLHMRELEDCPVSADHFVDIPPIPNFVNLPSVDPRDGAAQIYALGMQLSENCPQNDCRLFLNIFEMCRNIDEQIPRVSGWTQELLVLELRKRYFQLKKMYCTNYAVRCYRCERNREAPPQPYPFKAEDYAIQRRLRNHRPNHQAMSNATHES